MNPSSQEQPPPEFLLDVTRLIWRTWGGRLPTGIDRVCLAYLKHFATRSLAVVQRKGVHLVLSRTSSQRLFSCLLAPGRNVRVRLAKLSPASLLTARRAPPRPGMIYLNVGHTALDEASLPSWIAAHRIRAVFFIHDLIPITHPEFCRPAEASKHCSRMTNVLASAAGVIGNSEDSLRQLSRFAGPLGLRMPPSLPAWISGNEVVTDAVRPEVQRPYYLTIGTIEGRKNHRLLLEVWRNLVRDMGPRAPALVIVGQRGWKAEDVFAILDDLQELEGYVLELGACDDRELAGWISGARAVLMPSFAEGFGLPVIEALQLGTPVLASDLPVFREIAGSIPTYLDPNDTAGWNHRILDYLQDSPDRLRQLSQMNAFHAPDWGSHFAAIEGWMAGLRPADGVQRSGLGSA